ncbi:MAG: ribonuclease J, partial [Bacteriovoracaceae bacterium]
MSENNSQKEALSVTPLGGVGEIGSNCTVLENEEHIVIIDYGILFPYEDFFDINYLIASLDSVKKNAENSSKKVSIFITHGHEDHIGAIVHLNQVFPSAEIHAPRFAEKLMRKKLQASGQAAKIINYTEDIVLDFGNIQIHPIQVTHSIPDTFGLVIQEKNNGFSLLFISDFKFDLKPLYEKAFNFEKIKGLFEKASKKICMIDSTNILNTGKTLSESDLVEDLEEIIRQPNRVFVTLFSSNIYRVKTLLNLAKQNNKKVVPIGRSVRQYIESASECGIFEDEIGALQKEEQVQDPLSSKYIYILTGCQGDHFGALRRVANSEHKFLSPKKGDVFLFSSKP